MQFKQPKDNEKYKWTNHVKDKMMYYGISESLVKRIIRFPKRKEEGIAPETVAVMSPYGRSREARQPYRGEIWVMYQDILKRSSDDQLLAQQKRRVISAWRYPGVSPVGRKIPIPDDILQELENVI